MAKKCQVCELIIENNRVRKCPNCGEKGLVKFDLDALNQKEQEADMDAKKLAEENAALQKKIEELKSKVGVKEEKKSPEVRELNGESVFKKLGLEDFWPKWGEHLHTSLVDGRLKIQVDKEFYKSNSFVKPWLGFIQKHIDGLLFRKDGSVCRRVATFGGGALWVRAEKLTNKDKE
jgi:hypothetical protein